MQVFVTGASGVVGRAAVAALLDAGHEVTGLVRSREAARTVTDLGARPVSAELFDVQELAEAMRGCDAVANLATKVPVGSAALRPGSLREIDRLRIRGSRIVAAAARRAEVSVLVHQSLSFVYADAGEDWIDEDGLVEVSRATEPIVVAEDHMAGFTRDGGRAVSLRLGLVTGTDPNTRWQVRRAASGRAFTLGDPRSWMHVVHPSDVGTAVAHALQAPAGIYNVGAEPVRRSEFAGVVAEVAGGPPPRPLPSWVRRVGAEKLEILTRSQRVSSQRFADVTGWAPAWPTLGTGWLTTPAQERARG
ncbi:NAD(P)-dependent oxidoreductase [Aeromicrobium sp. Leaf350]|uniref:NAD-dependent epimerase/dehydratase family protein n=1 Tax=Aeromicrobium sp. Leaf350 TaxID=2876565 RepID=UPI001E5CF054|nr:NAD(P)-dependent oxidoreductase [Aeromicrobium sp. Leaf350]